MGLITFLLISVLVGLVKLIWMFATRNTSPDEEFAPPLINKNTDCSTKYDNPIHQNTCSTSYQIKKLEFENKTMVGVGESRLFEAICELTPELQLAIENSSLRIRKGQIFMHYPCPNDVKNIVHEQELFNRNFCFWEAEEQFEKKSLPEQFATYETRNFMVNSIPDSISCKSGIVAPWFGMPGGGKKYFFESSQNAIELSTMHENRYIDYIKQIPNSDLNDAILNDAKKHVLVYDNNLLQFSNGSFMLDGYAMPLSMGFQIGRVCVVEIY